MYLQLQLIWMSNKLAIKFSLPFVAVTVVATALAYKAAPQHVVSQIF